MATLKKIKRKRGVAYQIGFYRRGAREWLSLPRRFTLSEAQEVKRIVEAILDAQAVGRDIDARTAFLIDTASTGIKERLAALELIEQKELVTITELLSAWEENANVKPRTIETKQVAFKWLAKVVACDRAADSVSNLEVERLNALLLRDVSKATRAGVIKDLKAVYNWGVKNALIESNPFDGLTVGTFKNKEREHFVSLDTFTKILDATPQKELKALFCLYRFGGLRLKEALALRWQNVDFKGRVLLVPSEKTARYDGHEIRKTPIFPELYSALTEYAKEQKASGETLLFTLTPPLVRHKLKKAIEAAGVEKWPRLVQNLRSSRAIELNKMFGAQAEAAWLGHSEKVAQDHYLHVTAAEFAAAAQNFTPL